MDNNPTNKTSKIKTLFNQMLTKKSTDELISASKHSELKKTLNAFDLIILGIGAVVGILSGAKIISLLLKKFRQSTYSVIIGLIVGSLLTIFPSDFSFNSEGIIGIVLGIIGFIIPILFDRMSAKKETEK